MSETLFDPTPYVTEPSIEELESEQAQLILTALNLRVDEPNKAYQLIKVTPKEGAAVFEPGKEYLTTSYDKYDGLDHNQVGWRASTWRSRATFDGFLQGAFRLEQQQETVILQIEGHCTDVRSTRLAIALEDIAQIAIYSEEAASVLVAYQNAQVDGDTFTYQRFNGYPTDVCLDVEELEPYVNSYLWPKPTTIFTAGQL